MSKEIERKFLLNEFPSNKFEKIKDTVIIAQSYVSLTENVEVRIRKEWTKYITEKYTMTYKNGIGLIRKEIEFEIDKDTYEDLLGSSTLIIKTRHYYQINGYEVSIDAYGEKYLGLIIAEVEFDSEETANKFVVPDEFIADVTNDKRYKNKYLWRKIQ